MFGTAITISLYTVVFTDSLQNSLSLSTGLVSTNSFKKKKKSSIMFHFLHRLVSNFVCLQFGLKQVTLRDFIRTYLMKTAACNCW